jgi:hypothetical protein
MSRNRVLARKRKSGTRGTRSPVRAKSTKPRQATEELYEACSIKRARRTKEEIEAIRAAIKNVLDADHPQTVRQVFYQLVVRGVIEKTENEYQTTVIRLLTDMRLAGEISFERIIDSSRITHETQTFDSVGDALRETA